MTIDLERESYKEYDMLLAERSIDIDPYEIKCSLYFNTILEVLRIILKISG